MAQPIRLRVRNHGAYQLEFKIDYELSLAEETRTTINTYIFVPHSLGINSRTYFNQDFHRDIQNYVRLRTPRLSLDTLDTSPASPLVDSERIVAIGGWYKTERHQNHLINNFKLMRPVLNASLRAHLRRAQRRVSSAPDSNDASISLQTSLDGMITQAGGIIDRFRQLERRLEEDGSIDRVISAFYMVDEAVSLVYEDALVWAYRLAERYLKDASPTLDRIGSEIEREVEHRRLRGCRSILHEESANEEFLQISSALKKYTTSVLYLSTSIQREGKTLEQVFFAIAAGLSMVFATVIAFYSQARYGTLTFPVFVALVVGYMFKDRIKEVGRSLFAKYVRRILYDQRTVLYTPDGLHELGHLREKMTFIHKSDLAPVVLQLRNRLGPDYSSTHNSDEEIICYAKDVTVERSAFGYIDIEKLKITGIRDIMRYDIRRYLRKMADPYQRRYVLVDRELDEVDCHKVYQVIFITEYRSWNEEEALHYRHTVVHMDQNGITDVRHLD